MSADAQADSGTTANPEGLRRFYPAGIAVAPRPGREQTEARHAAMQRAVAGGRLNVAELPPVEPTTIPVFVDDAGNHHIIVQSSDGRMVALPYVPGERLAWEGGDYANGGYLAFDALPTPLRGSRTGGALSGALGDSARTVGRKRGWLPSEPLSPPPTAEVGKGASPEQTGEAAGRESTGAGTSSGGGAGAALQTVGQVLDYVPQAYGLLNGAGGAGGIMNFINNPAAGAQNLFNGLAGMGVGQLLSIGSQALMSKLFPLDDESSLGSQVAAKLTQEVMGELQAYAQDFLMDQLKDLGIGSGAGGGGGLTSSYEQCMAVWLGSVAGRSNASQPLARLDDPTDHGGKLTTGEPSVLVVGKAAARATDMQACPMVEPGPVPHVGGPVREGNPTILIKGLLAARLSHKAICTGCGAQTALGPLQTTVLIGEKTVAVLPAPVPPSPPSWVNPAAASGFQETEGEKGSSAPRRKPTEEELDKLRADRAKYNELLSQIRELEDRKEWLDPEFYSDKWAELDLQKDALVLSILDNESRFDTSGIAEYEDSYPPPAPQKSSDVKKPLEEDPTGSKEVGLDTDGPSLTESQEFLVGKMPVSVMGRPAGEVGGTVSGSEQVTATGVTFEGSSDGYYTNPAGDTIKGEASVLVTGDLYEGVEISGVLGGELGTHIGPAEVAVGGSVHTPDKKPSRIPKPGLSVGDDGVVTFEMDVPFKIPVLSGHVSVKMPAEEVPDWIRKRLPSKGRK